jgi:AcrR family transcriptional regulator
MSRPREFDEALVLDQVLKTFWARGYEGTSIDDLTAATGLARASLYGAFGDKTRLFERAITHYTEQISGLAELVTEAPSVREGLRRLFARWIEIACPSSGPKGCFLLLSAGLGPSGSDFASKLAARSRQALLNTLEAAIRLAQANGELARTAEPRELAGLMTVILQGIATGARVGTSRAELSRSASAAVALLL